MIPISSVFSHLPCPDGGRCARPYCRYGHSEVACPRSPDQLSSSPKIAQVDADNEPPTEMPLVIQQENYDEFSYGGYYANGGSSETYTPITPMYNPFDPYGKLEQKKHEQNKVVEKKKTAEFSMLEKPSLPVDLGNDDILKNLGSKAAEQKKPKPVVKLRPAARPAEKRRPEPQPVPVSHHPPEKKAKFSEKELEEMQEKARLFDLYMNNINKVADIDAQIKEIEHRRPPKVRKIEKSEDKPSTSTKIVTASSITAKIPPTQHKISARTQMLNRLQPQIKKKEPVNVSLLLAAEKRAVGPVKAGSSATKPTSAGQTPTTTRLSKTSAQSVEKGEARQAHQSSNAPLLPLDMYSNKIPMAFRTKYLKMLYTEFCKHPISSDEAIQKAQKEEKEILDKCTTESGYTSQMVGVVRAIRSGQVQLGANATNAKSVSELRAKKINKGIEEEVFYRHLQEKYLMTDDQLKQNGYPYVVKVDGKKSVAMESGSKSLICEDGSLKRTCCRCGSEFLLRSDGTFDKPAECVFHWKRAYRRRVGKTMESRYDCCGGDMLIPGCAVHFCHVHDVYRSSVLRQFVRTPPSEGPDDPRSRRVYAMDCEMVYTTWGMSVARVSVVDMNDDLVLDLIIKPNERVLDCNTRFSGLTQADIDKATSDLDKARRKLFELVNAETILIGHSLESDLRALRLVHRRVVDTTIVFPHRNGPPLKRALRNLASEYLQKIIQENVQGHDSKEDSAACIQLMLYKVRSDTGHCTTSAHSK